jgi:hypothetical protein
MTHVPYESIVGSVMYAMVCTQPDIVDVVGVEKIHFDRTSLARVFKYLCGTKDYVICYQGKPEDENEVNVNGFVDAD